MPLVAMGERLREGRQKRGLSVEEVAANLKISPRLIRDLETGAEPSLPHAVYVRGFIKSYARLLDINPEDLAAGLAVYDRDEESTPASPPARPRSGMGLLLLAVFCALAFAGYWCFATGRVPLPLWGSESAVPPVVSEPLRPAEASAAAAPAEPPAAPAATPAPAAVPTPAPAAVSDPAPAPAAIENNRPVADQPAPEPLSFSSPLSSPLSPGMEDGAADGSAATAETAGEEAPVRASGFRAPEVELPETGRGLGAAVNLGVPHDAGARVNQLVLTGMAECWVHATADETDTRQFSVRAGETFSLSFSKSLLLKLGNAGGVSLKYNGVQMPAPGKDGQVLTLRFPEAGSG